MTRSEVIEELDAWIDEDPSETSQPTYQISDTEFMSIQDLKVEVEKDTQIGRAFVRCYNDAHNGLI